MSNSINFVGRLGADAEFKQVGDNSVLEFRICCSTGWGEREIASWYRCTLWGKRGEKIEQYLTKGKQVFVSGELTMRPWTTSEGVEKMSADINLNSIDLIGSREDAAPQSDAAPGYDKAPAAEPAKSAPAAEGESDADLPF